MRMDASFKEEKRQKQGDLWLRFLPWLSGVGWLAMVLALYFAAKSLPQAETLIERWHQTEVDSKWHLNLLHWMFRLSLVATVAALVGLAINSRRLRRKKDEWRVNLFLLLGGSVLMILFYFLKVLR